MRLGHKKTQRTNDLSFHKETAAFGLGRSGKGVGWCAHNRPLGATFLVYVTLTKQRGNQSREIIKGRDRKPGPGRRTKRPQRGWLNKGKGLRYRKLWTTVVPRPPPGPETSKCWPKYKYTRVQTIDPDMTISLVAFQSVYDAKTQQRLPRKASPDINKHVTTHIRNSTERTHDQNNAKIRPPNSRGNHDLAPHVGIFEGVAVADVVQGIVRPNPRVHNHGRARAADRLGVAVVVRVYVSPPWFLGVESGAKRRARGVLGKE